MQLARPSSFGFGLDWPQNISVAFVLCPAFPVGPETLIAKAVAQIVVFCVALPAASDTRVFLHILILTQTRSKGQKRTFHLCA
jgi:hypothetical protein